MLIVQPPFVILLGNLFVHSLVCEPGLIPSSLLSWVTISEFILAIWVSICDISVLWHSAARIFPKCFTSAWLKLDLFMVLLCVFSASST